MQHNTNLNIQRSQSTQRFQNSLNTSTGGGAAGGAGCSNAANQLQGIYDTNKEYDDQPLSSHLLGASMVGSHESDRSDNNMDGMGESHNERSEREREREREFSSEQSDNVLEDDEIDYMNHLLLLQQLQQNEYTRMQHHLLPDQMSLLNLDLSSLNSLESEANASSNRFAQSSGGAAGPEQGDCEYLKVVKNFCDFLVLPQAFFDARFKPICFCSKCNTNGNDKLDGWVYFKLNQQTVNASNTPGTSGASGSGASQIHLDLNGDWLPFYYMTLVEKIRAILDRGQPLPLSNDVDAVAPTHKDEPGTRLELYYSPNATAIKPFVTLRSYLSEQSVLYSISTSFEVYVRRQSISGVTTGKASGEAKRRNVNPLDNDAANDVGHGSCGAASSSSSSGPLNESTLHLLNDLCWFTKEAGACIINALLIKLDPK